jgi:putative glutamine amidotransferase
LIDPRRQAFELALLEGLDTTRHPLLAICLGMQLMCLHAGGTLEQYLPETLETAEIHWNGGLHAVTGSIGSGDVHSHHRQAISDPGRLQVVGVAPDGMIEAVADPDQPTRIGVQWHPERTECQELGTGLFRQLAQQAADRL